MSSPKTEIEQALLKLTTEEQARFKQLSATRRLSKTQDNDIWECFSDTHYQVLDQTKIASIISKSNGMWNAKNLPEYLKLFAKLQPAYAVAHPKIPPPEGVGFSFPMAPPPESLTPIPTIPIAFVPDPLNPGFTMAVPASGEMFPHFTAEPATHHALPPSSAGTSPTVPLPVPSANGSAPPSLSSSGASWDQLPMSFNAGSPTVPLSGGVSPFALPAASAGPIMHLPAASSHNRATGMKAAIRAKLSYAEMMQRGFYHSEAMEVQKRILSEMHNECDKMIGVLYSFKNYCKTQLETLNRIAHDRPPVSELFPHPPVPPHRRANLGTAHFASSFLMSVAGSPSAEPTAAAVATVAAAATAPTATMGGLNPSAAFAAEPALSPAATEAPPPARPLL